MQEIWGLLPSTVLAIKVDSLAILIDPPSQQIANRLGGKEHTIAYYGYSLTIHILKWEYIENYSQQITCYLGSKITLALIK